jgi:hypothetical protein
MVYYLPVGKILEFRTNVKYTQVAPNPDMSDISKLLAEDDILTLSEDITGVRSGAAKKKKRSFTLPQ